MILASAGCAAATLEPPPSAAGLTPEAAAWVERTMAGLDLRKKIAQLLVPRVSGSFMPVGSPEYERVRIWVQELGVGGLIETLGPPLEAAVKLNMLQRMAAVPLLIAADMEHGPGQLLNGGTVLPYGLDNGGGTRFPPAMGLGAAGDEDLARELGRITALEGRAIGVHMNFAPVVDVNNNAANPIINTRSFGADPDRVGRMAAAAVQGMQSHGMLATAKHFPGHGDTETDSHIELPVITVTRSRVDSIELRPYAATFRAGVAAVMSAHIAFPALTGDSVPATLQHEIMTGLLRDSLGFDGLVVTDALDMGAIVRGWGRAESAVLALEAGADLLLQMPPSDVAPVIDAIEDAVRSRRIPAARIDASVRRVLSAKARLGLHRQRLVDVEAVPRIVGTPAHRAIALEAAERSITLVRDRSGLLPLRGGHVLSVVYREGVEPFAGRAFNAALSEVIGDVTTAFLGPDAGQAELEKVREQTLRSDIVVFSPFVRVGAFQGRLAIAEPVAALIANIARERPVIVVSFGSPYVLEQFPAIGTYLLAWGQWDGPQLAAASALSGRSAIRGRLPIPIPPHHAIGDGITMLPAATSPAGVRPRPARAGLPVRARPEEAGLDASLGARIDSIVTTAIAEGAAPGAAIAVGRHGRLVHLAGYGKLDWAAGSPAVTDSTLFDVASLTKVVATTTAAMVLVDEGRLALGAPVSRYLPGWAAVAGDSVSVRNLLRHDAGLPAHDRLWREARGPGAYLERITSTPLEYAPGSRTVYSDFGAILLGFLVERAAGQPLDAFVSDRLIAPLGLSDTGFRPLDWLAGSREAAPSALARIAPTENDTVFRMTHVHGHVHDENAFAMGGVAGHAGLFSSARDLAVFAQMLLNGGTLNGRRIIEGATVREFVRRQSEGASRALGWDTPSPNSSAGEFFPASAFGHTGFTGTSVWIDPERDVFVVLLTNRVNPTRDNQLHVPLRRAVADAVQLAIRDQPVTRRTESR